MNSSLKGLKYSFLSVLAGTVLIALNSFEILPRNQAISLVASALFLLGAISYYIFLIIVTARAGKNAFVWVGLTFITSPIGILVSYLMIKDAKEGTKEATP